MPHQSTTVEFYKKKTVTVVRMAVFSLNLHRGENMRRNQCPSKKKNPAAECYENFKASFIGTLLVPRKLQEQAALRVSLPLPLPIRSGRLLYKYRGQYKHVKI